MAAPNMRYRFGDMKAVEKVVHRTIYGYDGYPDEDGNDGPTIGDMEFDPDAVYFEVGAGTESVLYKINQATGKIDVKYRWPADPEENHWGGISDTMIAALEPLIVDTEAQKGGGRRKRGGRRNTRKRGRGVRSTRRRN